MMCLNFKVKFEMENENNEINNEINNLIKYLNENNSFNLLNNKILQFILSFTSSSSSLSSSSSSLSSLPSSSLSNSSSHSSLQKKQNLINYLIFQFQNIRELSWCTIYILCHIILILFNLNEFNEFYFQLINIINNNFHLLINYNEIKVREICCKLIIYLIKYNGYLEYNILYNNIIISIQNYYKRDINIRTVILGDKKELELDEVSGWKALETLYNSFKELVRGLRGYITLELESGNIINSENIDQQSAELYLWSVSKIAPIGPEAMKIFIEDAGLHINRYVRQSCCELIHIMCQSQNNKNTQVQYNRDLQNMDQIISPVVPVAPSSSITNHNNQNINFLTNQEIPQPSLNLENIILLTKILAIGLQDSWCQVRLAASIATNSFLLAISDYPDLENHVWPLILPRLCLNRHYSTDSVKEIAQDTWIHRLGSRGRQLLSTYANHVIPYFVSMTRHKNHIVCEAACASIAEIGKLIKSYFFIFLLMTIRLIFCLHF